MAKAKSKKELEDDRRIRSVAQILKRNGVIVRRENLARGSSFKVKSGDCTFSGEKLLFVDRRLPAEQQMTVLVDYLVDAKFRVLEPELGNFPKHLQTLLPLEAA